MSQPVELHLLNLTVGPPESGETGRRALNRRVEKNHRAVQQIVAARKVERQAWAVVRLSLLDQHSLLVRTQLLNDKQLTV